MWTGDVFSRSSNPEYFQQNFGTWIFCHHLHCSINHTSMSLATSKPKAATWVAVESWHCREHTRRILLCQLAIIFLRPAPKLPHRSRQKTSSSTTQPFGTQHCYTAKNMQQPCVLRLQSSVIPQHKNMFDVLWTNVTLACFPTVWVLVTLYLKMRPARTPLLLYFQYSQYIHVYWLLLL